MSSPTAVNASGMKFAQISAGGGHTCALTQTNVALCWGFNSAGQIGDGTEGNIRLTPVRVLDQTP